MRADSEKPERKRRVKVRGIIWITIIKKHKELRYLFI